MANDQRQLTNDSSIPSFEFAIINPLERSDWDQLIARFPQSTVFHSSPWIAVLKRTYGFQPLAAILSKGGQPAAIIALMEIKSWITGKRAVSLPFSDACSPLYHDLSSAKELYKKAIALAAERGWRYLELRDVSDELNPDRHSLSYYRHALSLEPGPKELFSQFSSANRRAIRKSEKSGVNVTLSSKIEDLKAFYRLLCLTRKRHGLPPQPWAFFEALHEQVIAPGAGSIFIAKQEGTPCAAAVFLTHGKSATYKFGASDPSRQESRPNNLLMWRAISHYCEQGYATLDFGRTALSNQGLRTFKRHWNPTETLTHYDRWLTAEKAIQFQAETETGWFNRVFRILPTPLSRAAGACLYKHVA